MSTEASESVISTRAPANRKQAAFSAWSRGDPVSDADLKMMLDSVDNTIDNLRAMGVDGLMLMGLILQQQSLRSAQDSRMRPGRKVG